MRRRDGNTHATLDTEDNPQGPTVQHRGLCSVSQNNLLREENVPKVYVYTCDPNRFPALKLTHRKSTVFQQKRKARADLLFSSLSPSVMYNFNVSRPPL